MEAACVGCCDCAESDTDTGEYLGAQGVAADDRSVAALCTATANSRRECVCHQTYGAEAQEHNSEEGVDKLEE